MTLPAAEFAFIRDLVHADSAMVLAPGKEYLVESRLLPLARETGLGAVVDLVTALRQQPDPVLRSRVVDAMTINETSWFRDRAPFTALAQIAAERLATSPRPLQVWSAACASGQEPYTIAMVLRDLLAERPSATARVLATDLSQAMVDRTRTASYSQLEVNRGLPAAELVRSFERVGAQWRVRPELRALVEARRFNLAQPFPALPAFDVVFLRNVLIYFDLPTKQEVLRRVRAALAPGGYLFLGSAETTLNIDTAFEPVSIGPATAYRVRAEGVNPR
jgi:chemotaxis protein methyltransferase CheR